MTLISLTTHRRALTGAKTRIQLRIVESGMNLASLKMCNRSWAKISGKRMYRDMINPTDANNDDKLKLESSQKDQQG